MCFFYCNLCLFTLVVIFTFVMTVILTVVHIDMAGPCSSEHLDETTVAGQDGPKLWRE